METTPNLQVRSIDNENTPPEQLVSINLAAPAIADPFTRYSVQGHPDALGTTGAQRSEAAPVNLAAHPMAGETPVITAHRAGELASTTLPPEAELVHQKVS